jgi:hypothetical protein
MTIEAMEKHELPVLTLRAPAEVQVTKRAAQLPQAFERLLYPDGALPLPQAYERLQELFAHAKNPDAFLVPFLRGDLVTKVFDPERNRIFALTPDQIKGYVSEHGSPDLLFVRDVVADIADGPLAGYEGLAPYVERSEFEKWLATRVNDKQQAIYSQQSQPQATPQKRGPGAPATKRKAAEDAIRKRWPEGVPPELTNVAVQAQVIEDLAKAGGPSVSPRTVDQARRRVESDPQQ